MKILLTGSNGFLGSFIKKNLKKNNMFIDFDLPKNNIMNFNKLNFLFKKKKPDLIIHAAAAKGAQISNFHPKKFIDVNAGGTLNILEAMRKNDINKIVYISSSGFYKRSNKIKNENSKMDFNNPYSYGKFLGEKLLEFYSQKYGFKSLALRPNLISGKGLTQDNLIYEIINEIDEFGTATIFGTGSHVREFIHPLDISDAINLWIKKNKKNFVAYNITCNRFKVKDVIKKIIKFLGKGRIIYTNKSARVFSLKLSTNKIKKDLNWRSIRDLNYLIKDNYEK